MLLLILILFTYICCHNYSKSLLITFVACYHFKRKPPFELPKNVLAANNSGWLLQPHNLWYIIFYLSLIVVLQPLDKDLKFEVFFAEFALK